MPHVLGELAMAEPLIANGRHRCGCTAEVESTGNRYISWCPMHEATPKLSARLVSLCEAVDVMEQRIDAGKSPMAQHWRDLFRQAEYARALLATLPSTS